MRLLVCPICKNDYQQRQITGRTVICGHCHGSYSLPVRLAWSSFRKLFLILLLFISMGCLIYQSGIFDDGMTRFKKELFRANTIEAVQMAISLCPRSKEASCRVHIYSRLLKIKPEVNDYKAKLAMALTTRNEFRKAKPLYEQLTRAGFINYDLLASMGKNQEGLGELEAAAKSYSKALALDPSLVEVIESLSRVLVKLKRPTEALSLLESFIDQFQGSKKYLQAQVTNVRKRVDDSLLHADQSTTKRSLR